MVGWEVKMCLGLLTKQKKCIRIEEFGEKVPLFGEKGVILQIALLCVVMN